MSAKKYGDLPLVKMSNGIILLNEEFEALYDNQEFKAYVDDALDYGDKIKKDHPDFKIILGNEIYLIKKEEYKLPETRFWHFILLAKDLKGYMQIRELRKRIARILTVLKEREAK